MSTLPLAGYLTPNLFHITILVMDTQETDSALKYAWAYLLTYGKLTNGNWSYYGGTWEDIPKLNEVGAHLYVSSKDRAAELEAVKELAINIGISWDESGVPEVHERSYFLHTFSLRSGECLATLGRLVLLNGQTFLLGSSDDDAAHLAEAARSLIKKEKDAVQKLAEML